MANVIGIKIANGEFYPVIEENSPVKKRLVLTTVRDRQDSMHINLYRSQTKSMADSQYIGRLVMSDLLSKDKGEPSIEVTVCPNENGEIVADALDLDKGGERQTLSVSIESLDKRDRQNKESAAQSGAAGPVVGFDLEGGINQELDLDLEEGIDPPSGLLESKKARREEARRPSAFLAFGLGVLFGILASFAVWFFFFGGREVILAQARWLPASFSAGFPSGFFPDGLSPAGVFGRLRQ